MDDAYVNMLDKNYPMLPPRKPALANYVKLKRKQFQNANLEISVRNKDKPKAIDIGCGDGKNLLVLETMGYNAIGIDVNETLVERAKEQYKVNVRYSSFQELPPNHKYNVILASHLLDYLPDPNEFFEFAKLQLTRTGNLIIEIPFQKGSCLKDNFHNPNRTHFFNHYSLAYLAYKHGFICQGLEHIIFSYNEDKYSTLIANFKPIDNNAEDKISLQQSLILIYKKLELNLHNWSDHISNTNSYFHNYEKNSGE